jgi:hypothetical protein
MINKVYALVLYSLLSTIVSSALSQNADAAAKSSAAAASPTPAPTPFAPKHAATINETPEPVPPPAPTVLSAQGAKLLGIEVGINIMSFNYEEPGVMKDTGLLYGVETAYQYDFRVGSVRGEFDFLRGVVDYDGSKGTSKFMSKGNDYLSNLRVLWIGKIDSETAVEFHYFGGLGARYLHDKTDGGGTYSRNISYLYLPIGMRMDADVGAGWALGGAIELDGLVSGTADTRLSEADPQYSDIQLQQRSGRGARLSGSVKKDFDTWTLKIEPYFHYWHIDVSEPAVSGPGVFVEPDNNTKMFGLNTAVLF